MYWFTTSGTGLGSLLSDKVLAGGEAVEGGVGLLAVAEELVLEEPGGDGVDGEFAVEEVPELDAGGSVGAPASAGIDAAVPLRAARRQDMEFDAELRQASSKLGAP